MIPPTKTILDDPDAEAANAPQAPMTDEQAAVLRDLSEKLNEPMDGSLSEAEARERIHELREQL